LKSIPKILLSLSLLAIVQIGLAATTGSSEKASIASLDKDQPRQTGNQPKFSDQIEQEPEVEVAAEVEETSVDQDSVEDNSVSKYNFIFHFLYRFKYSHEEATL